MKNLIRNLHLRCIFLLLLFVSNHGFGQIGQKEKIRIYLGWTHQFQFAGYYAAIENGYFDSLGYEVELIQGRGGDFASGLMEGRFEYSVATGATVLGSSKSQEIKVLAAIFQVSPLSLITLKTSDIRTLKDLEGQKVTGRTEIKSMLKAAGVDLDKVDINPNQIGLSNLLDGEYAAITHYIADRTKILGSDSVLFKTFRPIEFGVNFYGECLITTQEEVRENPKRAENIRSAVIRGWQFAVNHPETVAEMIFEKYNVGFTRQELIDESDIIIHSLVLPYVHDIGDMQKSKWNQMYELVKSFEIDSPKDLNIDELIYEPPTEPGQNSTRLLRVFGITIGLASLIMLGLSFYNFQLKKAVNERTQSLQKTNDELDRFVYSVSHDIKSPLSSIQGIINLMRLDPEGHDRYMNMIEKSVVQLEVFTSEILDYSRNARADVTIKPVDINALVDNSITELKYLNQDRSVDFVQEIRVKEPFPTDEWRLKIILNNLISNAVKYSDNEKPNSFVKISANKDNGSLKLKIQDNGIGIEEQHLDKIYNMFYRATESSRGSGLGLYIVNETIKVLNGKIDIQSEIAEGTTITMEIPDHKE